MVFKGSSGFRDGKTSEQDERMGLDLPSLTWAIVRMGAETHVPSALQEVKSLVGMGLGGTMAEPRRTPVISELHSWSKTRSEGK